MNRLKQLFSWKKSQVEESNIIIIIEKDEEDKYYTMYKKRLGRYYKDLIEKQNDEKEAIDELIKENYLEKKAEEKFYDEYGFKPDNIEKYKRLKKNEEN